MRFPARLLAGALALTTALCGWMAWNTLDSYRFAQQERTRDLRLEHLDGEIMRLDEVLTMSARMAAATGDLKWEQRYRQSEPQLDAAIKEIITLVPDPLLRRLPQQTDAANVLLVDMENRSFEAVRAGHREAASAILFSPAYEEQKQVYADGMKHLTSGIRRQLDALIQSERRRAVLSIVASLVMLVVALGIWGVLVRSLRSMHVQLEHRIQERTMSLRQSEARHRTILQTAMAGFWLADTQGRLLEVNEAYCRMSGYSTQELLAMRISDLEVGETAGDTAAHIQEIMAQGEERFESRHRRKDGSTFDVEVSVQYRPTDGGRFVAFLQDITERKQAEEELRFRNAVLHTQQEVAINGILVVDENARILSFNRRFVEMWRISADIIESRSDERTLNSVLEKLIEPDLFLEKVRYLYQHRDESSRDEIVLKDGRTFDRDSAPMLGDNGTYYGRVWYFRDITERKRVERRQCFSAEILRILNESAGLTDVITPLLSAIKRETGFDAVGIRLRRGDDFPYFVQTGFSSDFLLDENTLVARSEDDGVYGDENGNIRLECTCGLVLSGQTDPASPLFTPGGSFWTNNSLPLLDLPPAEDPRLHPRNRCIHEGFLSVALIPVRANQDIVGLLQLNDRRKDCFTLDIVHSFEEIGAIIGVALLQKRAEGALRQSEERHRTLFSSSQDAIMTIEPPSWRFTSGNPACVVMFGAKNEEEFTSHGPWELSPEHQPDGRPSGEQAKEMIETAMREGSHFFEWTHKRIGGEEFPATVLLTRLEIGDHAFLQATVRDISRQKHMEMELNQAQKLEAVGRLAAGIAHEINTPTQYVGDNIEFLQIAYESLVELAKVFPSVIEAGREGPIPPPLLSQANALVENANLGYLAEQVPRAIEQSLEGVGRISTIVQAMKEFSHPGTTAKSHADLNQCIRSTVMVSHNEWKYVADLETDLDPTLPDVLCVAGEINQVLLNMIVNAAHAIGDVVASTEQKGRIEIRTRQDRDWAVIEVADTGNGIPEEIRGRIFDPFFTTKEVGRGTGQGLAIARNVIVDKHGGTLAVQSEVGKGTTFIIRLPIQDVDSADGLLPSDGQIG